MTVGVLSPNLHMTDAGTLSKLPKVTWLAGQSQVLKPRLPFCPVALPLFAVSFL